MAVRPAGFGTALAVASSAVAVPAKPKDDSDEWRFLRFLELRRHERKKIQQEQDMQRLSKVRKLGVDTPRQPVLALPENPQQGRPGRVGPPPSILARTPKSSWGRSTGADLDASIRKAMQDQQQDKAEQRGRFSRSLQECMDPDMTVAAKGMPKMVKLMEGTTLPHERKQLLQVLEKTALLPDGACWSRFVELKGTLVLQQWIKATASVTDGALEGESDKIVCGCINVLMRLDVSLDRANAEGLTQTCENISPERSAYVRKLALELVRTWRSAADLAADGDDLEDVAGGEAEGSSSDSDSSSSSSGSGAADAILASALGGGSKPAKAAKAASSGARYEPVKAAKPGLKTDSELSEKRKQEAETQRTLDSLLELGKMLDPTSREEETVPDTVPESGALPLSSDEEGPFDEPAKEPLRTRAGERRKAKPPAVKAPASADAEQWEDPNGDLTDDSSAEQLVLGSDDGDSTDKD